MRVLEPVSWLLQPFNGRLWCCMQRQVYSCLCMARTTQAKHLRITTCGGAKSAAQRSSP